MSILNHQGNRVVTVIDNNKCNNCYFFNAPCHNCRLYETNYTYDIMTFEEYKENTGDGFETYQDFLKYRNDLQLSEPELFSPDINNLLLNEKGKNDKKEEKGDEDISTTCIIS